MKLDFSDVEEERLAKLAGRVADLVAQSVVAENAEAASQLDDLLGALYSLALAHRGGFEDRADKPIEVSAVHARAVLLKEGRVRMDGKWMAGYYFNSGLLRLAAVQHRLLKVLSGNDKKNVPDLHELVNAQTTLPHQDLDIVHAEVNVLKHDRQGVHDSRKAQFAHALGAADEILRMFEYWSEHLATPTS